MSENKRKWTENQQKAIDARGMQILVSAAAGSGKTSVLTERVKQILCDTENRCSVSEILVVTFTRAAASEMRDRIYKALSAAASEDETNSDYLRRQMTLLPTADICTIDSFCAKIVRENFHLANVGADFKMLDEKDDSRIMQDTTEEIVSSLYDEDDGSFKALTSMFLSERDDSLLCEIIKKLYGYSRSYPSPFTWLDEVSECFNPKNTPDETGLTEVMYKYIYLFSDFHISRLNKCVSLMEESGNFSPDYFKRFTATAENLCLLRSAAENKNWDALVSVINNGIVVKPPARNYKVDDSVKKITQEVFDELETEVKSLIKHTLPLASQHQADCEKLYPVVKKLCEAVKRLTVTLDEIKKEKNTYNFDDILHKCINLLIGVDGNHKTPLANELSAKYKEILIDEYQDTNQAQNKIFETISRNKTNLYVVGDVKQSIYRFRLASPELFTELRNTLEDFDGSLKPSQIILENNFRSRKGVTEAVNYIFEKIMSNEVGEIDYNEREFLRFSASYFKDKPTPDTELVCIDTENPENGQFAPTEPSAVAEYIKRVVKSGVTMNDGASERPVKWGDFCILLRSMKNKGSLYAEELKKAGIPVSCSLEGEASEYKEIQFLSSLIKVISNPLLDVPLIAVLISPIFGFSPDEISEIRMIDRNAELYACLVKYAESSLKAQEFLQKLNVYRNISAAYPVSEFVKFVCEDTAVADIYYAAGDGDRRKANIKGFIRLADDFTESGRMGLSEFVRYIDNAAKNGGLKSLDSDFADTNCVRIMSIHKSKGLEFPYVIIADCSKAFNRRDSYQAMTVARETGIGLKIRDDELFTSYHTLSSGATEKAVLFGEISEELRVLYVAMTRAKEHLAFVCDVSSKTLCKRVKLNNIFSLNSEGKLHPYAVYRAGSVSEWILSCFASHKDCGIIRDLCSLPSYSFKEGDYFGIDTSFIDFVKEEDADTCDTAETVPVDYALLKEISENINYEYPYDFSGILAKRTASSTELREKKREYFAQSKPAFLSEHLSGAERGTAVHKFLELCDFKRVSVSGIKNEIGTLLESGMMSPKESEILDKNAIDSFLNSPVGNRLISSDQIFKEYEFSVLRSAKELYSNLPEYAQEEKIVVQGKLDCAFIENGEAVLIDYKTDNITDEESFVALYNNQLKIYADALEECTSIPVKETYIYSFKLRKFISV